MRCAILRLMSMGEPVVRPRAMRDSEAIQATTPTSLKWAEGGPALGHKRSRVLEGAFPGFHFVEDIGNRGRGRREVRGAKQRGNPEVPGLSEARYPNIGRAATSGREWGRNRGGVDIGVGTPRIGGLGGGGGQASQAQARP